MSASRVELVARVTGGEMTAGLCGSLKVTAATCHEQRATPWKDTQWKANLVCSAVTPCG